jgi:hypothetical protein
VGNFLFFGEFWRFSRIEQSNKKSQKNTFALTFGRKHSIFALYFGQKHRFFALCFLQNSMFFALYFLQNHLI